MKITEIRLRRFKDQNVTHPLDTLNVVTGGNESGKSAVISGLQFAIQGNSSLGDKPEATLALCGSTGGAVGVSLDSGQYWLRKLSYDRMTGKASTTIELNEAPVGVKKGNAAIQEACGSFAPQFDISIFLGLSADKRREFVMALCSQAAGETNKDELLESIRSRFLEVVGGGLGEQEQLALDINMAAMGLLVGDVTTVLAGGISYVKGQASEAKTKADAARQAGRKLSEQKAAIVVPAKSVQELQDEKAQTLKLRDEIVAQKANQEGRQTAKASEEGAINALTGLIEVATDDIKTIETVVDADDRPGQAEELEAQAIEANPGDVPTDDSSQELRLAYEQAWTDSNNANNLLSKASRVLAVCETDVERARQTFAVAKADPWTKVSALLNDLKSRWLDDDLNAFVLSPEWLSLDAFVSERCATRDIEALRNRVTENEAYLVKAREGEANASTAHDQAKATADQLFVDRQKSTDSYAAQLEAHAVRRKRSDNLREQAQGVRKLIESREQSLAILRDNITKHEAEIIERNDRLSKLLAEGGFLPVDQLDQQSDAHDKRIAEIDEAIKAKREHASIDAHCASATADAEQADVELETAKGVIEAIKFVRERYMADLIKPLIDRMSAMLVKAYPDAKRVAYCDLERTSLDGRTKPVFDIGVLKPGNVKVTIDAMSGGERSIFAAALSYALVMMADPPLKLLLVEAGEVDQENLHRLLAAVASVADDVSNAIVATFTDPGDVEGWNVIRLDAREAVGV